MLYPNAKPNIVHMKLAQWEKEGKLLAVVTYNAYFLVEDLFIDLMIHACDCKTPP